MQLPHSHAAAGTTAEREQLCQQVRHLDLALWMRFFSGAWLPSTSMASPAPAEASRCRLRPTLLTERLRARAIALLASRPTLSKEACAQDRVRYGLKSRSRYVHRLSKP